MAFWTAVSWLYVMMAIINLVSGGVTVLLVWGVAGARPQEARFHLGPSMFSFRWRGVLWSFSPLFAGVSLRFEPEAVDAEGGEQNVYTRLSLPRRLLSVVSTFLGVLLLALVCLSPSRGLASILSGFSQLLNVFAAHERVLGFFLRLKTEGFWVALGVLSAKVTALNLLPCPTLPGFQLLFELWRPRRVPLGMKKLLLGVGAGVVMLLWVAWAVGIIVGLLSLRAIR